MSKFFGTTIQRILETVAIEKGRIASKEVIKETPNSETIAAINEVQQMKQNSSLGKSYTDIDGMMKDLLSY